VTEFLIFLAMCGGFSLLLWRFVRRPSDKQRLEERDRRVTDKLVRETAELKQMTERARASAATSLAQAASPATGFGRKSEAPEDRQRISDILTNPVDRYDGLFTLHPFGHDIVNATSRTIPRAYRGKWVSASLRHEDRPELYDPNAILEIDERSLKVGSRVEPVVAVESGEENNLPESEVPEIAIVSESPGEKGKWAFSLLMLSLQDKGRRLVNVESMDAPWVRMPDA
jgi:hypothetical protein